MGGATTRGSHTLSPPRDTVTAQQGQPLPPRLCWGLPSARRVPGPVSLGAGLAWPRVQSQHQRDPLSGWAPLRAPAAVLASPRGVLLCWHCPGWLRSAVSHPPAPASHLFLPPKGTLLAHSRGDLKGHTKYSSPLFSPLHWGFYMDLTTWKQPHASAQPALLGPQSITNVHQSPGPGCSKSAVTTHSESTALPCPCPWEVAFLFCGAHGTCQSSRSGTLPPQLSSGSTP